MPQITFLGAAETVTGSKYLVEADGARVLVDCGLFQGLKELRLRNWEKFPLSPSSVDALVLTHAHTDHIGYLPRFVREGFSGPAWCTPATAELADLMLFDAARNQEEDAAYANRKGFSKHHPALPLFDERDVVRALRLLKPTPRGEWFKLAGPIRARYHEAGHLLGSASIEMEIASPGRPLRILFSGDVGRYSAPLYHDPAPPPACDYLVCECTYGDRDHPEHDLLEGLAEIVDEGVRRGGVIVVAAFAVGRAQQLIYLLQVLIERGRIPELPIFLDSPMAANATDIFCQFSDEHDLSESRLKGERCVFTARNVHLARSVAESKALNDMPGPAVIISSSGMMVGGRVLHHLKQRLPSDRNTILLGGFMPAGTRGRSLEDGAKYLRLHGQDVPVRAAIRRVSGLSGHADRGELLRWLAPLPAPRRVFLTHGEKSSAESFANDLRQQRGWEVVIPAHLQTFPLEQPS